MGELLITYRWYDPEDHMSEKSETIKVCDVEDRGNAYFRVGILIGGYMKWMSENTKEQEENGN